jgi:ammonia channel protein AmtB
MEFLTYLRAQWDRTAAVAFTVVGLVVLLIGWIGVSDAEAVVKQLPYIMSGGIAGILFVAIGAVLWVSADLRDEWRELRKLRLQLAEMHAAGVFAPAETVIGELPVAAAPRARARTLAKDSGEDVTRVVAPVEAAVAPRPRATRAPKARG